MIPAAQWVEDGDDVFFLQRGGYDLPLELWRSDGSVGGTARVAIVSENGNATRSPPSPRRERPPAAG